MWLKKGQFKGMHRDQMWHLEEDTERCGRGKTADSKEEIRLILDEVY